MKKSEVQWLEVDELNEILLYYFKNIKSDKSVESVHVNLEEGMWDEVMVTIVRSNFDTKISKGLQ